MNTYEIYLQVLNKKLKFTIEANNETDAHNIVLDSFVIDKIKLKTGIEPKRKQNTPLSDNEALSWLKDIFNFK